MNADAPKPIPMPLRQRWYEVRLRALPFVVFGGAVCLIALLWNQHAAAPTLVGQAEPVLANISSYKPGVLAELTVNRFQRVKTGDPVGQVLVTDPRILASSLAVIQAEIEMLRVNMKPVITQQRNAMDYDQLRLDWMRQRAQLATARVNLQLAQTEFHRMSELFKDQIVSQRVYDQAKAAQDRSQSEVDELAKLVAEGEQNFQTLQLTNATEVSKVTEDPLRAAIAVQESKLRLTEAELSPIQLKAPMDGIVSTIYHRAGEAVTAGQPIAAIATFNPVRIVGYLRPPIGDEPKPGMRVEVRTRGLRRHIGFASVLEVGTQLETVPVTMLGPMRLANAELGLPVDISLPPNITIRAGELVDLVILPNPK
ncbi:MAG TPA: HlyD family efflux transporter periplasmic adaptor subunit [Verrucomicrobiae bacterium]|nr:HlyD family efflux transporter periplasmic adaptor subunit [Verrucomicrobiae bacterium]